MISNTFFICKGKFIITSRSLRDGSAVFTLSSKNARLLGRFSKVSHNKVVSATVHKVLSIRGRGNVNSMATCYSGVAYDNATLAIGELFGN